MEEIVVNPHTGRWWTVGTYGAEFVDIPKNAIVFNHKQSKALLENGSIFSRGKVLAGGTAKVRGDANIKSLKINSSSTSSSSTSSKSSNSSNNNNNSTNEKEKFDWIEVAISRVERAINIFKDTFSNSFKKFSTRSTANSKAINKTKDELDIQRKALNRYLAEANSVNLSETIKKKVRNGKIDIQEYGEANQKKISEYQKWYEKVLECDKAIQDLTTNLSELYREAFDLTQTKYEGKLNKYDHKDNQLQNQISVQEAQGKFVSTSLYKSTIKNEKKRQNVLNAELTELQSNLDDAVKSGAVKKYSEAWYEMQNAIDGVSESLDESNLKAIEAANSIRQIKWDEFDFTRERKSQITQESDFLIDQISEHKLYDDNGKMNKYGRATAGLHAINYNVHLKEAQSYANEIAKIDKDLQEDPTNKDLITRREELVQSRQDEIAAAKQEREALVDLVQEGINKELEALSERITKYKENLRSAKDLYDYQKKIKNQTKNISDLRKQISAYENDDSEEGKAKVQKLKLELEEAQEDLRDTEYEKSISDQEELLDKFYEDYEEFMNKKLEDVTSVVNDLINDTNNNSSEINKTIKGVVGDIGYGFATELKDILGNKNGKKLVSNNASESTSTSDGLKDKKVTSGNSGSGNQSNQTQQPSTKKDQIKVNGKINAKGAKIYQSPKDKVGSKQYFASDPVYTVVKEQGNFIAVRHHKAKSGITGWFKKKDVKAYKHGGLVDETGLAWLDGTPSKPETVLDAQDSKNLISLTDTLRDIASKQGVQMLNDYSNYRGLVDSYTPIMAKYKEMQASLSNNTPVSVNETNEFVFNGGINIPIEHVENYEDFVTKLRDDGRFEKMIKSMTIGQIAGKSSLDKKRFRWQ